MSNLTELLPAGGSGKQVDFVASGSLSNGDKVVLKTDGTVEVVSGSVTSITESIPAGSSSSSWSTSITTTQLMYDPNNADRFVVVYNDWDNSGYGMARVGTISNNSITLGAAVAFNSAEVEWTECAMDEETGKFVVVYKDYGNSRYGYAIVGEFSGSSSLSFGTSSQFVAGQPQHIAVAFNQGVSDEFIVAFRDSDGQYKGYYNVGTISGTSITFGSSTLFNNSNTLYIDVTYQAGTAVFVYSHSGTYGTSIAGTVSGTSITFGSPVVYVSDEVNRQPEVKFDPSTSNKFVVAYTPRGSYDYLGTVSVGTLSGTSLSFGAAVAYNGETHYTGMSFLPGLAGKFVLMYQDGGNGGKGTVRICTISGTTVTLGSEYEVTTSSTNVNDVAADYNTLGKFVIAYRSGGFPAARVCQAASTVTTTNLTSDNFLGTATKAASDGDSTAILMQGGLSTNQSGLTVGSDYYVQPDGTLATTAGTPSVKLGKALTSTTVLLSGE